MHGEVQFFLGLNPHNMRVGHPPPRANFDREEGQPEDERYNPRG